MVQLQGTGSGGYFGEVKLNAPTDAAPDAMLKMAETNLFPQLKNSKVIADKSRTKLGARGQFTGSTADVIFNIGDLRVRQQYNFVRVGDKTYPLIFTAPEAKFGSVATTFNYILCSLDLRRNSSPTSSRVTPAQLVPIDGTGEGIPIKFGYPAGWRMSREGSGDHRGWKFNGKNAAGHDAELFLWTGPRGDLTLEQLIQAIEDEHLKPLTDYRKVSTGTRRFGNADGQTQFSTFIADGLPGKQTAFFFADRDRFYCLALHTVAWSQEEMQALFDRVASSIQL